MNTYTKRVVFIFYSTYDLLGKLLELDPERAVGLPDCDNSRPLCADSGDVVTLRLDSAEQVKL